MEPLSVPSGLVEHASRATARVAEVLPPSPLQRSGSLSERFGREVFLKREDLQPVRSYKLRGAYNMIAASLESAPVEAVVCASAGNHAQGVAWACARLSIPATVVLPARTPRQKRDRIAAIGGEWVRVELVSGVYDDAACRAAEIAERSGALLVPPFDHPLVVAGQSTLTSELFSQLPAGVASDTALLLPVGGGGLAAGAQVALASHRASGRPSPLRGLVLAEPAGAASLAAARHAGHPVQLTEIDTFVDGAATRAVGELPFQLLSDPGVPLFAVPEGAVAEAMLGLYADDGIVVEPAGALAVAALRFCPGSHPVVAVLSGGNNDVSRYREVSELAMRYRGLRHYFLVEFPQVPGALRRFLDEVLGAGDDIVLFEYVKRADRETGPALVGIDLAEASDLPRLLASLDASPLGYSHITPDSPLARVLL